MKPETLLRKVFPPMLATLTTTPPRDAGEWVYELKYDGFRAVAALSGGELALWSRNEIDLAARFPKVADALRKLKVPEVVFDGEIVALDEEGRSRFQLLQQGNRELIVLFDVLWLDGHDIRHLPYADRRELLEKTLRVSGARRAPLPVGAHSVRPLVRVSEQLDMSGDKALLHAAQHGLEGVIAKRKSSVYEARRSKEWLKIKAVNEQELVVVGWNPSTHSSKEIGSLHLAVMGDDGALHYAGKVGTGFSYNQRVWWKETLGKDVVPKPMVKDAPRERVATWVVPRYVVQVAFTEWTGDNRLRHPSFLGMRDDKSPKEVVRERPQGVVTLTHPERVLYPKDKITKKDVADYYAAVSEAMIATLMDRPLALEHWNQGIHAASWFHQNVGKEAPPWVTTIDTPTRASKRATVRHLVVDKPETLQWLAQMSVLTIHMWSSRGASLDEPDWLVFDLDPAKGKGIEQAIEAAIVMRGLLENLKLPSVPKTSGKRGIHVFVPLAEGTTHEQAADFACAIAGAVSNEVPFMTVERALAKRRGRLYLDCMQNGYGKTMVAPYSLRAIDGAPVSAPLKWEEITKKLDPLKFNLRTMPDRLAKVGDLFARVFEERATLPELK
jgi:bifunctional non-homologous end joining protein LigD